MSSNAETGAFRLDGLKWLVVLGIIGGGTFANSYYSSEYELIYRVLAMVALGLLAAFIALNTAKGQSFWVLVKEAQIEVKKVVWPTNTETNQTSLVVAVVVVLAALLLWVFDLIINQIAKYIIG